MTKDLKELIDMAEEDEKTRAQLEESVETLKREIVKLNKKLEEKTSLAKIDSVKPIEEFNESEEINILKGLIASQKQELADKIRDTEVLQQKMEEANLELENIRDTFTDSVKDQVLIKTQNSLNNLIEDYGRLEGTIKSLNEKISELEKENKRLAESSTDLKSESSNVEQLEAKIYGLKRQLKDFERSKKLLEENINTLKSKQSSVEELENRNIELKEEKQQLKEDLKAAKTDLFKFSKKEEKVSELKNKIEELEKANKNLKEKDTLLLAKTITAINVPKREHAPVLKDTPLKTEKVLKVDSEVKQEKPQEQTKDLPQKLEINLEPTSETKEILNENEIPIAPSEVPVTRKKKCPKCGNTNKSQIREVDDKTRIIYTYPKIYAKMYKCGQCGAEWR